MSNKKFWLRIEDPEEGSNQVNATFVWTIDSILDRKEENGQCILSPSFRVSKQGFKDSKWQIQLYPRGDKNATEDNISIYLLGNIGIENKRVAYVYASIVTAGSFSTCFSMCLEDQSTYNENNKISNYVMDSCFGNSRSFTRARLESSKKMLASGSLTLAFSLTFDMVPVSKSADGEGEGQNEGIKSQAKSSNEVSEDFGKLLEDKDFCDMEINCGGEIFSCHQVIIAARSPVFRAMFRAKMKESESRKVTIEDIKPEIMAEMLYFLYTGLVKKDVSKDSVVDLLVAADKYQMDTLRNICQDKLSSALDAKNVIEFLILGEMYRIPKLKDAALMEVVHNMPEIADTEDYMRLKDYPDLLLEIPKAMFK